MRRLAKSHAVAAAAALVGFIGGCSQHSNPASPTSSSAENSILVGSTPAAGSTVPAPVNELVLNFDPPARLEEVTVAGPDGLMPTMITAVGEVPRYSIPLAGVGPGNYAVSWSATVKGQAHEGSFGFSVR